ncbi:hypothetical protein I3843_03G237900 [Carya illinoinensis]|uniref:Homeobox domain-containing protein n=1 Tax=Carya illinoinensis TaxID=32201 RepID=A0A922JXP6_CARIL|nr:homeobox-DDT domain protein RLT3-like isoform X2 [Carya illinoinensis]KAG6724161.1 hypothetical protein I3842_03G243900 [Carya illinoinensis]KAG7989442.1 hypothetical protein I3843_03G237900 [Carya illinoinensis]
MLFNAENKYPTKQVMEGYAAALRLTYKQVRGWLVERRDNRENELTVQSNSFPIRSHQILNRRNGSAKNLSVRTTKSFSSSKFKRPSTAENRNATRKKTRFLIQYLLTPDYIPKKAFRKDGPSLGLEFDSLPSGAFCRPTGGIDSSQYVCSALYMASQVEWSYYG